MSQSVAGVEVPHFEQHCRLAAELHVVADTLKLVTSDVERVFRVIAEEAQARAALEEAVDEAQAAVERAEKHHGRGGGDTTGSAAAAENMAAIAERRREQHAAAREHLSAFNRGSWAAKIQRLEESKARARAKLHVPITGSFQGPLMQRALSQGRPCAPKDIERARQAAMADFAGIVNDLARTATPHDGSTPAVELHGKWSAAALLTQANSQISADLAQAAISLGEIGAAGGGGGALAGVVTFQDTFARAQAASIVPRAFPRRLPISAYAEDLVGAPIAAGDLLPPAKHVLTCRLSARSPEALAAMFAAEMGVVRSRIHEAFMASTPVDGVTAMPPQSVLTGGRMLRRAARAAASVKSAAAE